MADRYWVGGTGAWTTSSTTVWSASSGGASGASVPTAADNVIFDSATTYTVTLTGALTCLSFTVSAGTVTFTSTGTPTVSGSMSLSSGTVWNATGTITFNSTAAGNTITTNNTTLAASVTLNGAGGSWQLIGNLSLTSTRTLILTAGTIDANNNNVSAGGFSSTGSLTRTLSMGSGTWTLASSTTTTWNIPGSATNITVNAGTSTISMTGATAKSFLGSSKTYYRLNQGGAGALTISGANTFADITSSAAPSTILFPAGSTTTVYGFSVSGTAGNLVTLNSTTPGTRATLSYAAGTINRDYLNIKDISATGGALWYAGANSVDSGNNLGWVFTAAPALVTDVRLRSFTERGRD